MARRTWIVVAGLLAACALPSLGAGQSVTTAQKAPAASGVDLKGRAVNPLDTVAGKTLVLVFVRSDCPISNRYAPTIKALSQKYADRAEFVLVYPDKSESAKNIEGHLHTYGYNLMALRDPQHQLVKLANAEITPEVAVFNGQRELVYHGRIDNWYEDFGRARQAPTTHELDDAIAATLNGGAPPAPKSAVGCYIADLQ